MYAIVYQGYLVLSFELDCEGVILRREFVGENVPTHFDQVEGYALTFENKGDAFAFASFLDLIGYEGSCIDVIYVES